MPDRSQLETASQAHSAELAEIAAMLGDVTTDLDVARAALASAERQAADVSRLASMAVGLLGDVCPVCEQEIDAAHVESRLRERASDVAELAEHRRQVEALEERVAQLRASEGQLQRERAQSSQQLQRWTQLEQMRSDLVESAERLRREPHALRLRGISLADARSMGIPDVVKSLGDIGANEPPSATGAEHPRRGDSGPPGRRTDCNRGECEAPSGEGR